MLVALNELSKLDERILFELYEAQKPFVRQYEMGHGRPGRNAIASMTKAGLIERYRDTPTPRRPQGDWLCRLTDKGRARVERIRAQRQDAEARRHKLRELGVLLREVGVDVSIPMTDAQVQVLARTVRRSVYRATGERHYANQAD